MNQVLPLVLAAEDEETDAFILRLAFERAKILHRLVVVRNGWEAVNYLRASPPYADRAAHPLPSLVLLDLKMPCMTGFDVLAWLATQPDFTDLPAVVLSSSADASDIRKAREMGARDYFVKPHELSRFVDIIKTLSARWLLPTGREHVSSQPNDSICHLSPDHL